MSNLNSELLLETMRRYANFNTDLAYWFVFDSQESEDILKFGGWIQPKKTRYGGRAVTWISEKDASHILVKLRALEVSRGLPPCDFTKWSYDKYGTRDLMYALGVSKTQIHARYAIGCMIYHQLLYTRELRAEIYSY